VGLRDTLFGRTKQVAPNLDNLFALPTAALTLQSELDLVSSGQAGLCFKSGSGETTLTTDDDIKQLLNFDQADTDKVSITTDDLGFKWLVIKDPDLNSLVTRIHSADTSMVENGLGPRLLCAVFGFVPKTPPGEGSLRLVYLMKQGTFYPFAPTGPSQRDNELELRVRSFLSTDLPIEKNLTRWMALWNLPVN
jgi:PspAB-like protein